MTTEVATRALTGIQKAALVLMTMSTDKAAIVMRQFSEQEAEEISAEIVRLRGADDRVAELAIREFQAQSAAPTVAPTRGGMDFASGLLEASFGAEKAAAVIERLDASMGVGAFDFLAEADAAKVTALLIDELPETVAFVLAHLKADVASAVLLEFEGVRRLDVAQSIATMGVATPEAAGIIAATLKARSKTVKVVAKDAVEENHLGGVQPLVDMMNHADPATERELMAALQERDPDLAAQVRALMLSFEDLPLLQDRDVQQVLRGIDIGQIALALKGAPEEISAVIRSNMSERNRQTLTEEAAELGRVPKSQVEEARNLLVKAIRELSATQGLELKTVAVEGAEPVEGEAEAEPVDEEEYVD
ncbi:flagellar motor switch protein FliG [Naasia lichenicola]|uniref:Flagellar motor switch protein FliG n=1 Tax=Naasia lichenicola TaxID=2565933 RepID=A0A4S4FIK3_9MICO|nr:FliG C-terminal domain-containing protein [Naasia lichenicola]THG29672.1 flagellar motor switch protein FliG [Naasia lichenicola]